jgi:hypothetical protein
LNQSEEQKLASLTPHSQLDQGGPDQDPTTLVPKQDNATRRNSAFIMITRALFLRQPIDYFCYQNRSLRDKDDGLKPEQILTPEDWLILTQLVSGLKVFHTGTITLEGHAKDARFGAMWECIPVLEVLSNNLIRLQDEVPNYTPNSRGFVMLGLKSPGY